MMAQGGNDMRWPGRRGYMINEDRGELHCCFGLGLISNRHPRGRYLFSCYQHREISRKRLTSQRGWKHDTAAPHIQTDGPLCACMYCDPPKTDRLDCG